MEDSVYGDRREQETGEPGQARVLVYRKELPRPTLLVGPGARWKKRGIRLKERVMAC
jgi:hypothetical protein